jgi:hypothetical protein
VRDFAAALPEKPKWVILVKQDGEFVSRTGEYPYTYPKPMNDLDVAKSTHSLSLQETEALDSLSHGNLELSIKMGHAGIYFIVHMNDAYWLGVSY